MSSVKLTIENNKDSETLVIPHHSLRTLIYAIRLARTELENNPEDLGRDEIINVLTKIEIQARGAEREW